MSFLLGKIVPGCSRLFPILRFSSWVLQQIDSVGQEIAMEVQDSQSWVGCGDLSPGLAKALLVEFCPVLIVRYRGHLDQ